MEKSQAEDYLTSLLNKTLRITTTDTRMFLGQFKCTDSDRNIILSQTFEYRLPPAPIPTSTSPSSNETENDKETVTLDLTSRYMGLVVVPGEFISRIEVEEFESQVRGRAVGGVGVGGEKVV
ncbi:LSM domain protein [Hyaloscypha hepaticicola]|uniref:LSM domain protein n=1 Tax=Hyaloscypha hepaticicola TaxID=2082293 RepID=A0A2J6QEC9_9HELO|nr:LSM domain protein [Hyaloscypha hepaticicola]